MTFQNLRINFLTELFLQPDGNINPNILLTMSDQQALTPINCLYCQQPCQTSTLYQVDPNGHLKGWKCDRHAHEIQYVAIPSAQYYAFYYTIWHKTRCLSIEAYKLPNGETWELHDGDKIIMKLNFLPEGLTPDNIDGRLPTLLVFS